MEEDLLLEEQIKKKKRLVLLLLLTLLLITAGAAALLEPVAAPATAIAEIATPPPAKPTISNTPTQAQGDEWTAPSSPSPENKPVTSTALLSTTTASASSTPRPTKTPTATQAKDQADAAATRTPTFNPPHEVTGSPSATISPVTGTTVAETSLTTATMASSTEVAQSITTVPPNTASPTATEISKRINESWEVLDGYVSISGNEVNVSKTDAVTKTITGTATLSETTVMIPPNGLPVTGIIAPHRMNWAALVIVVLLIGAGAIALIYPKQLDNLK